MEELKDDAGGSVFLKWLLEILGNLGRKRNENIYDTAVCFFKMLFVLECVHVELFLSLDVLVSTQNLKRRKM